MKMLCQLLMYFKKRLLFTTTKISICSSLLVLPNLANICLHNSKGANFYPFTIEDKDLLENIRERVVGGSSIVVTRKAVVDQNFIRKSANIRKSVVGIDASQLYPYSMCQPMSTGLHTRWHLDTEAISITPRQNKTHKVRVFFFFQQNQIVKLKASIQQAGGRKMTVSVPAVSVLIATLFEAMGCFLHFRSCQANRSCLTAEGIQCGSRKQSSRICDDTTYQKHASLSRKIVSVSDGDCTRQPIMLNLISEKTSFTGIHLQNTNC